MATDDTPYDADVNFLFEMGNIRLINRVWRRFHFTQSANLAEHHFRVFWIAMIIAQHEGDVDTGKIAKLALVHDIAESRVGDVDYLSRQYVDRNQELAIKDMLGGTAIEEEFLALWEEYEERKTLESQIVKDADNLDVDFELAEQAATGAVLKDVKHTMRVTVSETKLYTKTAKKIFDQILASNPHDWHSTGRNRIREGDWKQEKIEKII